MASQAEMMHHRRMRRDCNRHAWKMANNRDYRARYHAPHLRRELAECEEKWAVAVRTVEETAQNLNLPARAEEFRRYAAQAKQEEVEAILARYEKWIEQP
jgi:hypothetical protein